MIRRTLRYSALLALVACSTLHSPRPPAASPSPFRFVDVTASAGLQGVHYPVDLRSGKIIATMGGGVAWGDYDQDGDPDLYVSQGVSPYRPDEPSRSCGRLFRNEGKLRFVDISSASRLAACGWGMGALFEDIDGDSDLDLFLTMTGDNQLWINQGDGTFTEEAARRGVDAPGFNCGAAFLDFDRDGDLDLYLTRYLETSPQAEADWPALRLRMPEDYPAPPNVLLSNRGDGAWQEVPPLAGGDATPQRSLGVVAVDFDGDGWPDLFTANDRGENALLHNQHDGTFADATLAAGVASGLDGHWESAMGIAVGDVDQNGFQDLLVTNYTGEPDNLYLNLGDLVFSDQSRGYGLFEATHRWVGWGVVLADFDNDSRLDLVTANGHIFPNWLARLGALASHDKQLLAYAREGYRQPLLGFRGTSGGFEATDLVDGEPLRLAARGAAAADADGDGRLDLFVLSIPRRHPSVLLTNRSPAGHWLALDLRAPGRLRSPLGAEVRVESPLGAQHFQVWSGGSYLSSSATPLHVGLGSASDAKVRVAEAGVAAREQQLAHGHVYVLR